MMSRRRLFVLVEGRDHDRPFYERLLEKHASSAAAGFTVRLVENLQLDGKSAGGKPFALKLFDYFDQNSLLEQRNTAGPRQIVFMLDKDFDDFVPNPRSHSHLIHTTSADVESEILRVGKLKKSLSMTYGLSRAMTRKVLPKGFDPALELGQTWQRWLQARAISCACALPGAARFANVSEINKDGFGSLLPTPEKTLFGGIAMSVARLSAAGTAKTAELDVIARLRQGRAHEMVKGRLLAKYLSFLVKERLPDDVVKAGVASDAIVSIAMSTIDFRGSWVAPYQQRLNALLAVA